MEVLRPFQYGTLWMLKQHTMRLDHVITLYNDTFDHIDGVMQDFARNETQWKAYVYMALKFARQKQSK